MQRMCLCGVSLCRVWRQVGGKLPLCWVGLKRWVQVAALLVPISACAELPATPPEPLTVPATDSDNDNMTVPAKSYWPWETGDAQQPPKPEPYKIPTMSGDKLNFRDKPAALVKAPRIDADAVYDYVLACFPGKSKWNIDVSLRAQLADGADRILTDSDYSTSNLGNSYVAIVADLPLYSAKEFDREREREYRRRQDVAKVVADFITAIASRNHAIRELALYRSLEARAALRVQQGIVEATEQVTYLEKVAGSQESLIKQEARIMESRLKLSGMCEPTQAERINGWLKTVSTVPQ